ncbi:hypothetical protein E1B28_003389 [Marasmius oreades]|uniref:Uncharacterized protein n=1 Tax=Marasmius oreades TaxID=181124 RepID=A0A9P7RMG2_9AGAR|nr:uncharacterized protein E1B28_003389 [Marasmius oreades]KAG7085853.1 hypothetical protein E1B28_003389 [Marasmius oreades]
MPPSSRLRHPISVNTLRSTTRAREASPASSPPSPIYVLPSIPFTGGLLYSPPSSPHDSTHTINTITKRCVSHSISKVSLPDQTSISSPVAHVHDHKTPESEKRSVQPQKCPILSRTSDEVSLRSVLRHSTADGLGDVGRTNTLDVNRREESAERLKSHTLVARVKDNSCYPTTITLTVFRILGDCSEATEVLIDTGRERWVNVKGIGNGNNRV